MSGMNGPSAYRMVGGPRVSERSYMISVVSITLTDQASWPTPFPYYLAGLNPPPFIQYVHT